MIKIYKYGQVPTEEIFARENIAVNVEDIVAEIIADVRKNGDKALLAYAAKFDKAELSALEVTAEEIDEAFAAVEPEFLDILREAALRLRQIDADAEHCPAQTAGLKIGRTLR